MSHSAENPAFHGTRPGHAPTRDQEHLPADAARNLLGATGALAAAGLVLAAAAWILQPDRFAFSYLIGFLWVVSIGLGALFFVLIQRLVRAGWSPAPRRTMESISMVLPAAILLFVPLFFLAPKTYHAWMSPEGASDPLVTAKSAFLNPPFFYLRAAVYLLSWTAIALHFARTSVAEDRIGDVALTKKLEGRSAPLMILFALTTSFAGFDWLMSLDPHWASTMFGVYFFAGAAVSSLALLALITVRLQTSGLLCRVSTVEHRHDIGKLLFGFIVFWSYIAFCQYLLIWYANIPEETVWFLRRWEGPWQTVSLVLLFGHFVVPFVLLLSRHGKRNGVVLSAASLLILVMHWVDLYWIAMPNLDAENGLPGWVDLAGWLAPAGLAAFVVARTMSRTALYPLRDPRLAEAIALENP